MSWRYRHLPSLEARSDQFAVRCIQEWDIEPIRLWRNAQIDVLRQSQPLSADDQRRYFVTQIVPQMAAKHPRTVLFTLSRAGNRIGYGGLVHCDWKSARAEVSILMRPRVADDMDVYRAALLAFLAMVEEIAFDRLGFNRLCLETFDIRDGHVRCLEEAGFVREGRLREHVLIGGTVVDSLLHARLRSDRISSAPPPDCRSQAGGLTSSNPTRSIREPAGGGT